MLSERSSISNSTRSPFILKYSIKMTLFVGVVLIMMLLEKLQRNLFRDASTEQIRRIQENDSQSTIDFF